MSPAPAFSIVVPTRDRPRALVELLTSLTRSRLGDFEVIVVDDGSEVPVAPHLAAFLDVMDLTVLRQDNRGPAAARNAGAAQARGHCLAFTDDDCRTDPGWLEALARGLERSPGQLCGGRTLAVDETDLCALANQLLFEYLNLRYSPSRRVGVFFPSNNMCVPRDGFDELGGFDETMRYGEDRDFCDRWAAQGHDLAFVSDAVVYHAQDLSGPRLARLHYRYGGGSYHFWRRVAARRGVGKIDISHPGFYLDLLWFGLRRGRVRRGPALSALLALTQAANAAGVLGEAVKELWRR